MIITSKIRCVCCKFILALGVKENFYFIIRNLKRKLIYKHTIIFYGVESLLSDYVKFCKENDIEYYYIDSR